MIAISLILAFAMYVWIAVKTTRWLASLPSTSSAKWFVMISSAAVFILLPIWDEIAGRIYFRHLCESEGGIKVYKTIELGSAYWNPDGTPKFIIGRLLVDRKLLADKLGFERNTQDESQSFFRIRTSKEIVRIRETDDVLGSYSHFIHYGGWVRNHSGLHVTGKICPSEDRASLASLIIIILKKST